jgi:hypothetical protein
MRGVVRDTAVVCSNVTMAQALFNNGVKSNNVTAQILWLKARAGWAEAQPARDEQDGQTGARRTRWTNDNPDRRRIPGMSGHGSPCANSRALGPTTLAFTFSAALGPVHKVDIWSRFQWDG